MWCSANLRQIGLAMHSYHSVHNMFATSVLPNQRRISRNCLAEHVFLLPHLEQRPLYDAVNMSFADLEAPDRPSLENRTARRTTLSVFLCPSDSEPHHRNSYRFNRGRFQVGAQRPYDGPFSLGVLPSATVVTDGLSRTAFTSERIAGSFDPRADANPRDVRYPGSQLPIIRSDIQLIQLCFSYEPALWFTTSGRYWFYGGFDNAHYNHNGTPNDPRTSCYGGGVGNYPAGGLSPPRSYHRGVVNVLFGDGHFEAIADSINPSLWQSLGTYNAGD